MGGLNLSSPIISINYEFYYEICLIIFRNYQYYHVRFEQHSFEEHFIVCQSFINRLINSLGHSLTNLNAMRTIGQYFRLDDGHDSIVLANRSVTGKTPGILLDCQRSGTVVVDFKYGTPFGESASYYN